MDDLTNAERRLVLGALWRFRDTLGRNFNEVDTDEATEHEIQTMELIDSAARKLGGDPAKDLYGAPEY
ncbi:MAG TPA: hypothetical protein VHF24_06305 [Acidimicrobiales bacterium]|nr:hypothetical protein [Acidimicrobiales bacterium]